MQAATGHGIRVAGMDGAEVIRRAQDGDVDAFAAVASLRLERAFRLACAILGSEADAADATENALLAAWRELPRLREIERFDAWLDRILLNECRMRLHRGGPAPQGTEAAPDATSHEPAAHREPEAMPALAGDSAWDLERSAAIRLLDAAFEGLDAEDRAALVLHHLDDRPLADIADALHMPAGTVKWRLHEARAALLRALATDA
jgi:RNA polymerase sigma-70 factor (ECF subfamily)